MSDLSVQAVETAFSHGVEALCKNQALSPEVTSEVQLIGVAVAFARHAINSSPGLKNKIHAAMQSLVHRQDKWVSQQGGWVSRFLSFVQTFSSRKLKMKIWLVNSSDISH